MRYTEVARAASARGEVVLRRRASADDAGGVLELRVNGLFVMDDAETASEVALASGALAKVPQPRDVLVGGLGLGFTAGAVLADRRVERVVVAEIEEVLVEWFGDGTIPHGPAYLADPRLRVVRDDVGRVIHDAGPGAYDLVLLDVDNGPDQLVLTSNAELYGRDSLRRLARVLRPHGCVAIWSSTPAPRLAHDLRTVFGHSAVDPVRVTLQGRDEMYWLHTAGTTHDRGER